MSKDLKDVAVIVAEKAYGAYGKQMLKSLFKKKKEKKQEKAEQKAPEQPEVTNSEPVYTTEVQQPEVTNTGEEKTPEQPQVEAAVTEETKTPEVQEPAAEAVKEEKAELQTPEKNAKGKYPSLFSLFSEIMGGEENADKSGDDVLESMLVAAFAAWMGVDVYKERLEEIERQLQEAAERERQEKAKDKEQEGRAVSEPVKEEPTSVKTQSPAEAAFEKMADGKEQVTLGDLEKAGVNLKADLQPTLKALTKDHPEKLSELAPKGLGDKDKPVSKELAVALIERKQQRDMMVRNNMNMRA